jgi:hypothetical protein
VRQQWRQAGWGEQPFYRAIPTLQPLD